jgi:hypothetical protein
MTTVRKKILLLILCVSVAAILLLPASSWSQEDQSLDEILDGFEDTEDFGNAADQVEEDTKTEEKTDESEEKLSDDETLEGFEDEGQQPPQTEADQQILPSNLSLDGYIKLSSVYAVHDHKAAGTDANWQGLTRLRPELKFDLDAKLPKAWKARFGAHAFFDFAYLINGRDNFENEVLDQYEREIEVDEAWLMGSLSQNTDIKAGRQIVVWGRSDNIRITDVLNPLDLREPGLEDIEKIRLPVTMTKLDYFFSDFNISGIAIHELRFNRNPIFGADFFPSPAPLPGRSSHQGLTIEDTQFAAALNGIFHGWDASLYAAYIFDDFAYFKTVSPGPPPRQKRDHARVKMLGAAGNIAWKNWLLKAETAFFDDLKFTNIPGEKYSRLDGLIGFEYSGLTDTTVTIEVANQHLFDFDDRLEGSPDFQKENLFQSAIRLNRTFMNETLSFTLLANTFGLTKDNGAFQRFTVEYDYTDSIQIIGGAVLYQSGDLRRTRDIEDNDRIYLDVKYNFNYDIICLT